MNATIRRVEHRLQGFLSHYPVLYAIIAGTGIILFWRGIWHSVDFFHLYISQVTNNAQSSIDWTITPWWDGPVSMIVGFVILLLSGSFVSSFIGNEIILAGLRGEKQLSKKIEGENRTEAGAIGEIRQELVDVAHKIEELELQLSRKK